MKNTGSWGPVNKVVGGLKSGTLFAAANGKYLRIYYQANDDSIYEIGNDGNGHGPWSGENKIGDAN
jgi:hypothetical protein